METAVKQGEKGPPSQRRLHLINYLTQLAMCAEVSTHMVESGVALELCRQLRTSSSQELMVRCCQAVAVMLHHAAPATVCSDAGCEEMLAVLADILRDQFRCSRVKLAALTALGEVLARLADAEGGLQSEEPPPALGLCVTLLNRCLHRSEEVSTNLVAARTLELVASRCAGTVSVLGPQLAGVDTLQQLYSSYKHAAVDQLKVSATLAMSRLARLDPLQFCALLDRVGSVGLLENVHVALLGVQEAVLELFALALLRQPGAAAVRKLGQDGAFLRAVMRLLETPASLVRAKALLLVLLLCRADIAVLRVAAEHRLVLYLERELKRVSGTGRQTGSPAGPGDAMERCLGFFTAFLATGAVPAVLGDCCAALAAVQGRKHPSSVQAKALRAALPMLDCVTSLALSPSLRPHIVGEQFCALLGQLAGHAVHVDSGQTNVGTVDGAPQFLTHVLALVEAACHCVDVTGPQLLERLLLPPLACLTGSTGNADIRIIGLKLCGDIVAAVVLSDMTDSSIAVDMTALSQAVEGSLLPQVGSFY